MDVPLIREDEIGNLLGDEMEEGERVEGVVLAEKAGHCDEGEGVEVIGVIQGSEAVRDDYGEETGPLENPVNLPDGSTQIGDMIEGVNHEDLGEGPVPEREGHRVAGHLAPIAIRVEKAREEAPSAAEIELHSLTSVETRRYRAAFMESSWD